MNAADERRKPADMSDADWHALLETSDRLADALEDVSVPIALAALGNVICGLWQQYGRGISYAVMAEWLRQVLIHTKAMHQPPPHHVTKH